MKIEKIKRNKINEFKIYIDCLPRNLYEKIRDFHGIKSICYSTGILFIFTDKDISHDDILTLIQ